MSTTRKIRMTPVGLVAMPASYDEARVTGEDLAHDRQLCTAFAELLPMSTAVDGAASVWVDEPDSYEVCNARLDAAERLTDAWDDALDHAADNDLAKLRADLTRARDEASACGLSTEHEDAARAMLPETP